MSEFDNTENFREAGNVILVDPNQINVNPNMVNAIPQYQDMYINVDLVAERRGRSVIAITSQGEITSRQTGLENTVRVNMMGFNQNPDDPNYMKYTTNWYDDGNEESIQHEGFGITNIEIETNSSYIPKINIEFTDIRGLSFFNKKNSPYRIMFDFPPPIFTLTVKGYFGKMLKYRMHLVKYTSEFKADNGNFVINGEFVAIMYAPLTDIPFRYIVNAGLIDEPEGTPNPASTSDIKNTNELIERLKNLYPRLQREVKESELATAYDGVVTKLNEIASQLRAINGFRNTELLAKNGTPLLFIHNPNAENNDDFDTIENITNIIQYDKNIINESTEGELSTPTSRLYLGFKVNEIDAPTPGDQPRLYNRETAIRGSLRTYARNVLNKPTIAIYEEPVRPITINNEDYLVLDLTDYYFEIYKKKLRLIIEGEENAETLNNQINNLIFSVLGMNPTIKNIFKIILDDVDRFFNILRSTSIAAETSHNSETNKSLIIGDSGYKDITTKVHAFPLVISEEPTLCSVEEVRTSPLKITRRTGYIFPEVEFVNEFIDTFKLQKKLEYLNRRRDELDSQGNNVWLPFSPIDSNLLNFASSPYLEAYVSQESDNVFDNMLNIFIRRYYILTQYAHRSTSSTAKQIRDFYLDAEAHNFTQSIIFAELISDSIRTNTDVWKTDVSNFHQRMLNNNIIAYSLTGFNENTLRLDSIINASLLKSTTEFNGLRISNANIALRTEDSEIAGDSPVTIFLNENQSSRLRAFFGFTEVGDFLKFTTENIEYLQDITPNERNDFTRYLNDLPDSSGRYVRVDDGNTLQFMRPLANRTGEERIPIYYDDTRAINRTTPTELRNYFLQPLNRDNGNANFNAVLTRGFGPGDIKTTINPVDYFQQPARINVSRLLFNNRLAIARNTDLFNTLFDVNNPNYNLEQTQLILLSMFGSALSPFNQYPLAYGDVFFNRPMIADIPIYLPLYMGVLSKMVNEDVANFNEDNLNRIVSFFETYEESFKNSAGGVFIIADYFDIKNNLSENDKNEFINLLNIFSADRYNDVFQKTRSIILDYINIINAGNQVNSQTISSQTSEFINDVQRLLMDRRSLLVFSSITFKRNYQDTRYFSMNDINTNNIPAGQLSTLNSDQLDNDLKKFFGTVNSLLRDRETQIREEDREFERIAGDEDIRTQTYYSFKNINDKWLSGLENNNRGTAVGYPFNRPGRSLIESFAFVSRAMNPIDETIINPEILLDIFDDENVTVYTALSQILSINGFEFFPLQNFMSYTKDDWVNSFKIDTSGLIDNSPVFVCMYIGGASSYPSNIHDFGNYNNDGIVDIINPGVVDFSGGCDDFDNLSEDEKPSNPDFPYYQVRAFRARFGEQNQTMFTDFKIDSKEYPETNESIQILSRLAGDGSSQAPVPKGQNLFNLYENRAYNGTITGLGNVMIQPTQYFQIENIPLYNGAYVILDVKHNITPNHMMTTFSGVKILKYPIPRVKDAAVAFGFEGGFSNLTVDGGRSDDIRPAFDFENPPPEMLYQSMHDNNIKIKFT